MTSTSQSQQSFGVVSDSEYRVSHKRDRIVVWSGPFYSVFEADGLSLPSGGYMLTTYNGDKVRVECPSPRDSSNREEVDQAIASALNAHHRERGAMTVPEFMESLNRPAETQVECASCRVRMGASDHLAHLAVCVGDARTSETWLENRHMPDKEPAPKPKRDWHALRMVGLVVSLVWVAIDLSLLWWASTVNWGF